MTLSKYQNPIADAQWLQIRQHAETAHPREACGFILNDGSIVPCENQASENDQFKIGVNDSAQYLESAFACWHTHANLMEFSECDVKACKALNLPYAAWDVGSSSPLWLDPSQSAGLVGRPWNYGVHDCYSAVRDWFYQEEGFSMADYPRLYSGEWLSRGFTHFEDNYEAEGFLKLPHGAELLRGDVILMRIENDQTSNHVAVLESPEKNQIFHHCIGRRSEVGGFHEFFRDRVHFVVRRKN